MKPLRILVADDHEVVRRGLRAILMARSGWDVCCEAANGRDAVTQALKLRPDMIVMDISMPELNGLEATRQIVDQLPRTQVLILSAHESENLVRQMLTSGARGYVLKSDIGEDLIAAVEALSRGRLYFTSRVSEYVLGESRRGIALSEPPKEQRLQLSQREREVLQLLAEGKSNKEVGTALSISVKTVETHRANLMNKLGMHSLSDLVRYAIQNEIIQA
jgi:DNA-binding NarL/FixJ family response regulator